MAKTKDKVTDTVGDVRPYVERALRDPKVRDDIKSAVAAARGVYDELIGGRSMTYVAGRVATDKDIQDSLKKAIDDLRDAADRVQGKSDHKARNTFLLLTGLALGLMFNPMTGPGTRRWVSEKLFGGGEDDYSFPMDSGTNATASAPPPPPPPAPPPPAPAA
jgi:hypothetical protein